MDMAEQLNKVRIKSSRGWLNGKETIGGKPNYLWTQDEKSCWQMSRSNADHQLTLVVAHQPDAEIVA
jgi:hypothetical protein